MNLGNYMLQYVNNPLEIKINPKENILLEKSWKNVQNKEILLHKWLYFGHYYIHFQKTTIYVIKFPYFEHFFNFFPVKYFLLGCFWFLMDYLHVGVCSFPSSFFISKSSFRQGVVYLYENPKLLFPFFISCYFIFSPNECLGLCRHRLGHLLGKK